MHHAVPGREGGEVEHHWGCGLTLDSLVVVVVAVVLRVRVRVRVRRENVTC